MFLATHRLKFVEVPGTTVQHVDIRESVACDLLARLLATEALVLLDNGRSNPYRRTPGARCRRLDSQRPFSALLLHGLAMPTGSCRFRESLLEAVFEHRQTILPIPSADRFATLC